MTVPNGMVDKLLELTGKSKVVPILSRAPGRIEVLGNHTDYNGGRVLASTVDRFVWSVGIESEDVTLHSVNYNETISFAPRNPQRSDMLEWHDYAKSIYSTLARRKHHARGVTAVITGNVPIGAGLSSSAAFEISLINLIADISGLKAPAKSLAMMAFEAERLYCGISCGVMDQFTSQLGKQNSILAIDCAMLNTEHITLNPELGFVITDTMISRAAGDALNQRKAECQLALAELRDSGWYIDNLSNILPEQLDRAIEVLSDKLARRVQHIVGENRRVRQAVNAMKEGRIQEFGKLMFASHSSSKNLYEVSHPRLDLLVELAGHHRGVLGSRLTGAGFGGSVLSLVKQKHVSNFIESIGKEYKKETGDTLQSYMSKVPGGVIVESI